MIFSFKSKIYLLKFHIILIMSICLQVYLYNFTDIWMEIGGLCFQNVKNHLGEVGGELHKPRCPGHRVWSG